MENLTSLLSFDPVLIGVFAGLSMMTVQMLKNASPWVANNPMVVNMGLALFFAVMVVFDVQWVLGTAIITFLIMSAASGVYSSSKKEVNLPDYIE